MPEDAYGCRTLIFLASKLNAAKTSLWDQLPGQGNLMSTPLLFRAAAGLCLPSQGSILDDASCPKIRPVFNYADSPDPIPMIIMGHCSMYRDRGSALLN